jgi:HEAT repeat protein
MGRALIALLLAGTLAQAASGRHYLTEFGRRVLARTDLVVEARVVRVQASFRGITTAHLEVRERLSGYDRSKKLVLMYVDDLVAPDAFGSTLERSTVRFERRGRTAAPGPTVTGAKETAGGSSGLGGSRAGVRLAVREEGLFFLERKGASFSLVGLIPRGDVLYSDKRARLLEILQVEAIAALDLRARRAKEVFLPGLESPTLWLRGNSARETRALALRFPKLFSSEDGARVAEALRKERDPGVASALERTLRAIDPESARDFAAEAEAQERVRFKEAVAAERARLDAIRSPELRAADLHRAARRFGRASTGLVCLYLADESPLVRERAAHALAEYGGPSCVAPLQEALSKERRRDAATAMLHALGARGDATAVAVVAERLEQPDLERTAITALARIGGPEARAALERHRERATPASRDLIDAVLREEFAG